MSVYDVLRNNHLITVFQKSWPIPFVLIFNIGYLTGYLYLVNLFSILLLVIVLFKRQWLSLGFTLFVLLSSSGKYYFPERIWNLPAAAILLPTAIALGAASITPSRKSAIAWLRIGNLNKKIWLLMVPFMLITTIALVIWAIRWDDDLGAGAQIMSEMLRAHIWLILGLSIPGFALVNAFAEEVAFRGIVLGGLTHALSHQTMAILLQASMFAALHYKMGFPNGIAGYIMTFVFACGQGYLTIHSKGLLPAYITHITADLSVGFLLYFCEV